MLFLSPYQLFYCFQYLRDQEFNEILNERRDCKFCSLSFMFFAIFFDRTSMT